jgi:hypothetical protein
VSYTLDGTYDLVMVQLDVSGNAGDLSFFINGDDSSSNYDRLDEDGSETTGLDIIRRLARTSGSAYVELFMAGRWSNNWGVDIRIAADNYQSPVASQAVNNSENSPLNSFTFGFEGSGSGTIRVFGVNF